MDFQLEKVIYIDNVPAHIYIHHLTEGTCITPKHWHDDIEFDYPIYGRMNGVCLGASHPIPENDFLFVDSRIVHNTEPFRYTSAPLKVVTLLISYDYMEQFCPDLTHHCFSLPSDSPVRQQIGFYVREAGILYEKQPPYMTLKLLSLINNIVWLLLSHCLVRKETFSDHSAEKMQSQIREVVRYLYKEYGNNPSLKETASHFGMNASYFSRYFKQATGVNFLQYRKEIQTHYASQDLSNTQKTISQIAFDNGFPNVKSLIETFKDLYHCTPSQYRKGPFHPR